MIARYLAIIAAFLYAANACAAELTPAVQNGQLGLTIEAPAYPDTLRKDLTSGLTNRILIRVTLARGTEIVSTRAVEIAVRYDLWDEHFNTTVTLDGVQTEARIVPNMEQMQTFLRRLPLPRLFASNGLGRGHALTLTADILLNPVDRERMEMIRKWVAQNNVGPGDAGGRNGDLAVAIFNKIFEQYSKGAEVAAVWRETSVSRPFRLEELADESH
ncbi:hypothetical protein ACFPN2_18665 [Steroidobacter flavus]|uniref:DUF4390 domain-containing protein n=1 Tax=Steroidobacter flavus TaxID=1842136 RepID=A0ABV8SVX0_9GAMM